MALTRTIRGGLNASAEARAAVGHCDADLGWRAGDARMIASELVLNAWQHGHGLDERPIALTLTTVDDGGIRMRFATGATDSTSTRRSPTRARTSPGGG